MTQYAPRREFKHNEFTTDDGGTHWVEMSGLDGTEPIYMNRACPSECPGIKLKWVSVEDRLPELWKNVLVWWPEDGCDECACIGSRMPGFKGPDEIWDVAGAMTTSDEYQDKITHWMPLPAPPGENRGM